MGQGQSLPKLDYLELVIWMIHEGVEIPVIAGSQTVRLKINLEGTNIRSIREAMNLLEHAVEVHTNNQFDIRRYIEKVRICQCSPVTHHMHFEAQSFTNYLTCIAVLPNMGVLSTFLSHISDNRVANVSGLTSHVRLSGPVKGKKSTSKRVLENIGDVAGKLIQSPWARSLARSVGSSIETSLRED